MLDLLQRSGASELSFELLDVLLVFQLAVNYASAIRSFYNELPGKLRLRGKHNFLSSPSKITEARSPIHAKNILVVL